jgi:hypothetical protein
LGIAEGVAGQELRRAVAPQVRHDHPVAFGCQQRGDIDIAVDVVGPAVQKHDYWTVRGAGFGVTDIEETGVNLLY